MITKLCGKTALVLAVVLSFSLPQAQASEGVETAGEIVRWLIPATAWGGTFHMKDAPGRTQFYYSFIANLAATRALKMMVSKERPNGQGHNSFPSNHSSMAFQGAAFIHRRYGWEYSVPAYLGAVFVAWSRVESDQHDAVDVLAGAAIGIASSFLIVQPYRNVVVSPVVSADYLGVGVTGRW